MTVLVCLACRTRCLWNLRTTLLSSLCTLISHHAHNAVLHCSEWSNMPRNVLMYFYQMHRPTAVSEDGKLFRVNPQRGNKGKEEILRNKNKGVLWREVEFICWNEDRVGARGQSLWFLSARENIFFRLLEDRHNPSLLLVLLWTPHLPSCFHLLI